MEIWISMATVVMENSCRAHLSERIRHSSVSPPASESNGLESVEHPEVESMIQICLHEQMAMHQDKLPFSYSWGNTVMVAVLLIPAFHGQETGPTLMWRKTPKSWWSPAQELWSSTSAGKRPRLTRERTSVRPTTIMAPLCPTELS